MSYVEGEGAEVLLLAECAARRGSENTQNCWRFCVVAYYLTSFWLIGTVMKFLSMEQCMFLLYYALCGYFGVLKAFLLVGI